MAESAIDRAKARIAALKGCPSAMQHALTNHHDACIRGDWEAVENFRVIALASVEAMLDGVQAAWRDING